MEPCQDLNLTATTRDLGINHEFSVNFFNYIVSVYLIVILLTVFDTHLKRLVSLRDINSWY